MSDNQLFHFSIQSNLCGLCSSCMMSFPCPHLFGLSKGSFVEKEVYPNG